MAKKSDKGARRLEAQALNTAWKATLVSALMRTETQTPTNTSLVITGHAIGNKLFKGLCTTLLEIGTVTYGHEPSRYAKLRRRHEDPRRFLVRVGASYCVDLRKEKSIEKYEAGAEFMQRLVNGKFPIPFEKLETPQLDLGLNGPSA